MAWFGCCRRGSSGERVWRVCVRRCRWRWTCWVRWCFAPLAFSQHSLCSYCICNSSYEIKTLRLRWMSFSCDKERDSKCNICEYITVTWWENVSYTYIRCSIICLPWIRRAFDWFLTIFSPCPWVCWEVVCGYMTHNFLLVVLSVEKNGNWCKMWWVYRMGKKFEFFC